MHNNIEKARIYLQKQAPFYSYFLYNYPFYSTKQIETVATDGRAFYYNPEYVDTLTEDETIGVLVHEIKHIIYKHLLRMEHRDRFIWNVACDYVINKEIISEMYTLPKNTLIPGTKYSATYSEHYYDILCKDSELIEKFKENLKCDSLVKNMDKNLCNKEYDPDNIIHNDKKSDKNSECNSCDSAQADLDENNCNSDNTSDLTSEELDQINRDLDKETNEHIYKAYTLHTAKGCSGKNTISNLDKIITALNKPVVRWEEILLDSIESVYNNDYVWTMPNRRYINEGIYLPSIKTDSGVSDLVLSIDTSGSISKTLLSKFLDEIVYITENVCVDTIRLIKVDDKVTYDEELLISDLECGIVRDSSGGTIIEPLFNHIENSEYPVKLLIHFTDGYIFDLDKVTFPTYNIIWVIYGGNVDFHKQGIPGNVIYINEDKYKFIKNS